jgi:hypothetical protein
MSGFYSLMEVVKGVCWLGRVICKPPVVVVVCREGEPFGVHDGRDGWDGMGCLCVYVYVPVDCDYGTRRRRLKQYSTGTAKAYILVEVYIESIYWKVYN